MNAPSSRLRSAARRPATLALLAVVYVAGCRDAARDPVAALVAGETRGALALRAELPALPDLAVRGGVEDGVADAVELWHVSWDGNPTEGRELRAEAYRRAAPALADALGPAEARRMMDDVGLALGAVGTLDREALGPLDAEVARARTLHDRAEHSLTAGDLARAFHLEMEASDALRAVAPPVVARSLLIRAEAAMADGAAAALAAEDRERAHRLVEGARRAAQAGDWSRAIRRAFYASQLLGLRE